MKGYSHFFALFFLAGLISSCSYRFYPAGCEKSIPGNLVKVANLDSSMAETSGLVHVDGRIWTFNDSGGEAALYCIEKESGEMLGKTIITNATNIDWEDIARDGQFIYIADVGNNYATRDTLTIYRVPLSAMRSENEAVRHTGVITLSFNDLVVKDSRGFSSHDCEAIFAYGDSLYLFSKNWIEEATSVYTVPIKPGHYRLSPRFRYDVQMLVTGADLFQRGHHAALVGYRDYMPIVITYDFINDPARIKCGGKARIYPLKGGRQVEGICFDPAGRIFISAEKSLHKQALFRVGRSVL